MGEKSGTGLIRSNGDALTALLPITLINPKIVAEDNM